MQHHVRTSRSASLFILAALLCASVAPAAAQQNDQQLSVVAGVVADAASGRPLAAARVRLVEIRREDVTHEDGSFSMAAVPAGTYTLTVQRIGFQLHTDTVTVGGPGSRSLRVELRAAILQLSAMVVTGTVGARSSSEVLNPTTVVDGAALARKLAATVAATIQREPGISMAGMGPATARPVVRGLSGDRVVVLEDGARPGDLSTTSPDHAVAIDPLNASHFEIVRGPMSLLYGSSALGGVVNVIRDEIPTSIGDRVHGAFALNGASVNRGVAAAGFATTSVGEFALRAEGSFRTGTDMRTPIGTLDNTESQTISAGVGGAYVFASGHTGASYRYFDSGYGIPGGFIGGHENGVDISMQRHSVRTETEYRPMSGLFSVIEAATTSTDYQHSELQPSGSVSTSFDQTVHAADIVARHEGVAFLTQGAVGVRAQYRNVTTKGALRTPSTRDYSAAAFMVEEWEQGVLHLQGGLRYDWSRFEPLEDDASVLVNGVEIPALPRTFGSVSGAFGALVHASDGVQIGASVSRAFRTPDFNELYSDGPHLAAYSYDVGNPRIGQETGVGVDVFARLTTASLRGEVNWFRNAMSGFVFPRNTGEIGPQGGRPKFQYVGKDAVLTGAEGSLEWNFAPHLVAEGNISWVRGTLLMPDSIPAIDGEPARAGSIFLPLMPPLNGNAGIRYEKDEFFVGVDTRLAARQERLGDFETVTAGFGTVNMTAGVRIPAGDRLHSITLRIDNIANREYREHLSRVKSIMPGAGTDLSLLYRLVF